MATYINQDEAIIERYRAKYRLQDFSFRLLDVIAHPFAVTRRAHSAIDKASIKKVLIANGGHIGDVVMSTALLPLLHQAMPGVSIGFLTGTYSNKVVENHPYISRVHLLDHWYLTRSDGNKLQLFRKFHHQAAQVVRELEAEKYDLAIDLRAWFPNFIPILHKAKIPIRVGYDRVGGVTRLTHSYPYRYDRRHELDHQLDLLESLNLDPALMKKAWPCLPNGILIETGNVPALREMAGNFCILHPASSTPTRDWPSRNWIGLAQRLVEEGTVPVITGRGSRDAVIAEEIASAVPSAINLCNKLSWEDLLDVIRKANAVYSVETSIGHIASALGRPVISIYGGMADPQHWAPLGARVVTNLTPCHPCFRKEGCSHRLCLTGITVDQVARARGTSVSDP